MPQTTPSPEHVDPARTAATALLVHRHIPISQLHGVVALTGAVLGDTPIVIHDLNGEPLFHDYPLTEGAAVVGTIRCAAHRRLGAPVVSISHAAPGWDPDSALRLATASLRAREPDAAVTDSQLVCYAYPKIGTRLSFTVPGKPDAQSDIFDASSGAPVASSTAASNQFTRYSLLDSIPAAEASTRVAKFRETEQSVDQLRVDRPDLFTLAPATVKFPIPVPKTHIKTGLVKLSPFYPTSPPGLSHYAQITDYYCVDASAQMLLEHYGYNYTQDQIATAMGTTAAQGGTTGTGLTSGFTTLTDSTLLLSFDEGQTRDQQYQDATIEVDANRPLFTQVPHHYRVCMGYSVDTVSVLGITLGMSQTLYIYDPWPWNGDQLRPGAPYWENWTVSPVMWFGIVHHA